MQSQPAGALTKPITAQRRYPQAPLVGAAAAVFDAAGRVLLVRRGRPPRQGQWGLPGGLLDLGERLVDGAPDVAERQRLQCVPELQRGHHGDRSGCRLVDQGHRVGPHPPAVQLCHRRQAGDVGLVVRPGLHR